MNLMNQTNRKLNIKLRSKRDLWQVMVNEEVFEFESAKEAWALIFKLNSN